MIPPATESTAVVLGAGGATGWVFHSVVARTLRYHGIDAGRAGLLVGTSAGGAVAAALRAGTDPDEILESVRRGPSPQERESMLAEVRAAPKTLRPVAPHLARHALPGGDAAAVALGGLLPPGWFPTAYLQRFPGLERYAGWPDGLWICALRARDGDLIVFGRDRSDVSVLEAVEASSAVPGMFRPKTIGDEQFLDGGLVSPTHADLVVPAHPDLVVVSSPMSRPSRRPMAVHARRRLAEERAALSAAGIETVVVEPPAGFARITRGFPRRNPGAFDDIVRIAREQTEAALAAAGPAPGRR